VWDSAESCWMGTDEGPLAYSDRTMAQIASQMMEQMLFGTDLECRLKPKRYDGTGAKLRETVGVRCTPEEAIARIEHGS
jgi:hypothetical protein